MTVPVKRKTTHIQRSFAKYIKDNFETPNSLSGKVRYFDQTFNVEDKDEWVVVNFLSDGAGKKGETLVQIDLYSRIGGRRSGSDRYGLTLKQLGESLHDALHVETVQLYDFSVPASPTAITNAKLIVRNSDGKSREPESVQEFEPEDHVMRIAYTYKLITLGDVSRADQYYD